MSIYHPDTGKFKPEAVKIMNDLKAAILSVATDAFKQGFSVEECFYMVFSAICSCIGPTEIVGIEAAIECRKTIDEYAALYRGLLEGVIHRTHEDTIKNELIKQFTIWNEWCIDHGRLAVTKDDQTDIYVRLRTALKGEKDEDERAHYLDDEKTLYLSIIEPKDESSKPSWSVIDKSIRHGGLEVIGTTVYFNSDTDIDDIDSAVITLSEYLAGRRIYDRYAVNR